MLHELLGTSPAIVALREELARLLARHGAATRRLPPVLIQGETGTGKGLVAHLLHRTGPRADASFVDVNCAAIPDTLLEAELFGFERGAFTDARQAKAGLLQLAHRGTIFLDEIGLLPEALQAKLLKALEDRAVRRLGGTRPEPADAWVLAATSENLTAAIGARKFREDLYHRLAVMTVELPPLRERGPDILLLARHYLERASAEYGLLSRSLDADAETALLGYSWPGNVRELANLMERVALLADADRISAEALRLPRAPRPSAATGRVAESVNEQVATLERTRIDEALRAEGGNISRAAVRLGLPRNTLRYRMERHGLAETGDSGRRRRPEPAPPASPVRWQRTRVTLFEARLMDGGDKLPEHERALALGAIGAKVGAFGGRLIDMGPSTVKAAFGLEVAEDAARHAAHAALTLHRTLATRPHGASRSAPATAVALHTEEMLVGRVDDRIELDLDARRAAEDVLDSLLIRAGEGVVLVSAATKPFLERGFDLESVTDLPRDRTVWRIRGVLDTERHPTDFVSRNREMSLLEDLLAQVEEGRGQAVLLAGDPGIGKTRLLQEFRRRIGGRTGWLQGAAVSFGASLPFHPLIDLLKQAFSVQASDSDSAIAGRIAQRTASLGDAFQPSVRFLRWLLSIDAGDPGLAQLDPKLRRAGIFEAIGRFLHGVSEAHPQVVVLEDVQWMDPATGEFLAMLVESLASSRLLLCVTHRTGYTLPFAHAGFSTQLTLAGVSRSETGAIGSSLVGATSLSPELQQLVDEKSEGNPFFVEEVLRSLSERDLLDRRGGEVGLRGPMTRIDVPDRIQDILVGRFERLDVGARELLRVAAVVGREFPARVVEQVVSNPQPGLEERIRTLRTADLIHAVRIWPEVVYTFKHALTQDVAYQSQPENERSVLHARIGETIERVYADRLSEHVGVLAHHFTQAQQWDKALQYLLAAAQQAERSFAAREALALYDQARHASERLTGGIGDPDTLIAIHEAKARLYFVTSDFSRSTEEGERILPLARLTGNRVKEAEALATIAWASTWGRNLDAAVRYAGDALAVAEPIDALAVQGRAHLTVGFVRGVTGVLDESGPALEKAMNISRTAGDPMHRSLSLSIAGLLRNWTGDFAEAARLQDEGLSLAREHALFVPLLFSCFMRGMTLTGKGDYDEAFETFTEGLSLAERVGDEAIHHRLLNCLGWLYADLGDLARAEALNATSAQIGRRRNDPGTQPNAELNLAEIFHARGELARSQEQYDGVFRYWKDPSSSLWMRFRYSIRMFAGMGELALARGDLTAAKRHYAECLQLAERTGSRKNQVKALRLAAEIARSERDRDAAEGYFNRARQLAASVGNPVQSWKTELALGSFLHDAGRIDDAREAFARARNLMQHVRDGLRHEELVAAFDCNPDLQRVDALNTGV